MHKGEFDLAKGLNWFTLPKLHSRNKIFEYDILCNSKINADMKIVNDQLMREI